MKKLLLYICLVVSSTVSINAQSSSGYTRLGIGDPVYSYSGRRLGIGELGTSVADRDFISVLNPAGLNLLSRTRIEFGLSFSGLFLKDGNSSSYISESEFSGFIIGFPVSTIYGIGVAAGIIPYTNLSYKVAEVVSSSVDYNIEYEGKGGLSKVFIGTSYRLPFDLSVGATLDYYFGNLNYLSRVNFTNEDNYDSEYKRTYSPYSIGTTIGLITPDISGIFNSEVIKDFRFGFAANIISEMNADTILQSSTSLFLDTLGIGIVNIKVPMRISTGFSFTLNNNYLFMFDFLHQGMEDYRFNNLANANIKDLNKYSIGFEYRPEREPGDSFLEQIIFRSGLSYEELPYIVNGTNINEYSVSGGFSLPLTYENTLDVGIKYSSRGKTGSGLIKENKIRIDLGLSLGDIWFVRQEK